jgi:hypothetical protein
MSSLCSYNRHVSVSGVVSITGVLKALLKIRVLLVYVTGKANASYL